MIECLIYALYARSHPRRFAYVPRCDDWTGGELKLKERLAVLLEEDNGICLQLAESRKRVMHDGTEDIVRRRRIILLIRQRRKPHIADLVLRFRTEMAYEVENR